MLDDSKILQSIKDDFIKIFRKAGLEKTQLELEETIKIFEKN
jgi:hypothetical protein